MRLLNGILASNFNSKLVVFIISILLSTTLIFGVIAENPVQDDCTSNENELCLTNAQKTESNQISTEDCLAWFDSNSGFDFKNQLLFPEQYPMTTRANEVMGDLIGPGSHNGTLNATWNPVDFYTIYLNGTSAATDTDIITINFSTTSETLCIGALANPDIFGIDGWFFNATVGSYEINAHAITSGYHYIQTVAYTGGTADYWMNISLVKTTNNQNDGNNDFGNSTTAVDDDSFFEGLNFTYDYWDLYNITLPPNSNLTVIGEPSSELDLVMELYDAPNSSSEHMIYEADGGWEGEQEVLYFDTNVSNFTVYIRIIPWSWYPSWGNYWLNFSISGENFRPKINPMDPNMTNWNSVQGIVLDEDMSSVGEITLSEHFTDDGEPVIPGELTYSNSSNNENITVSVAQNTSVTFVPAPNWFGSAVVTFWADDSVFNTSDTVNITVNPINDRPNLKSYITWKLKNGSREDNGFSLFEGISTEITINADDPDLNNPIPDKLYYDVKLKSRGTTHLDDLPIKFTFDDETGLITFQPTSFNVGTFYVNVSVRDRASKTGSGVLYDWDNITFKVSNINDPPSFLKINAKGKDYTVDSDEMKLIPTATQNQLFVFYVYVSDLDIITGAGDTLTFGISPSSVFNKEVSQLADMAIFNFTPDNDQAEIGYVIANITVSDTLGETDYLDLTININNYNDPPEFTRIDGNSIPANKIVAFRGADALDPYETLEFTVEAEDPDSMDNLTFNTMNISLTQGFSPELVFDNNIELRWADVTFDPLAKRANTTLWINLTVSDDGSPVKQDWLLVVIDILPEKIEPPKYTLTSSDLDKSYSDGIGDVFVYDFDANDKMKTSKGGYGSIDIMNLKSKKDGENIVITIEFYEVIKESGIGLLTSIRVYVVKNTFSESGVHLNPKKFSKTDWNNHPYSPPEEEVIEGGFLLKYFEMTSFDSIFYDSTIQGNKWIIEMNLESFESNFGVSHANNQFEFFATSSDISKLQIIVSSSDLIGPKAYDSAGFGAASAPEPIKSTNGDGGGIIDLGSDMFLFILLAVICVVVVIVLIVVVMFLRKRKRAEAAMYQAQQATAPDANEPTKPCIHCGEELPSQETYCSGCGHWQQPSEQQVEIKCDSCGMVVPEGRYVCPFCSTPIPPEKLPPEPDYPQPQVTQEPAYAPTQQPAQQTEYEYQQAPSQEYYPEPEPGYPPQAPPQPPSQEYYPEQEPGYPAQQPSQEYYPEQEPGYPAQQPSQEYYPEQEPGYPPPAPPQAPPQEYYPPEQGVPPQQMPPDQTYIPPQGEYLPPGQPPRPPRPGEPRQY